MSDRGRKGRSEIFTSNKSGRVGGRRKLFPGISWRLVDAHGGDSVCVCLLAPNISRLRKSMTGSSDDREGEPTRKTNTAGKR